MGGNGWRHLTLACIGCNHRLALPQGLVGSIKNFTTLFVLFLRFLSVCSLFLLLSGPGESVNPRSGVSVNKVHQRSSAIGCEISSAVRHSIEINRL
jgi:hypothetical protein